MKLNDSDKCPVCRVNFDSSEGISGGDAFTVKCQRCGTYEISGRALVALVRPDHPEMLPYLSAYLRQTLEFEKRAARLELNWEDYAEIHRHTSVRQRLNKLLRFIENRTADPGGWIVLNYDVDYPMVDATSSNGVSYFVSQGALSGYLEQASRVALNHVRLTVEGWEYLDPGSGGAGIPGRVFVAMSFDESLNAAYELGIRKAIEDDCHMTAIRLDKVHHNEKICDKILAEIRRCQFTVADFTRQSQGVYFEAGFAMALGREVIRTCQEVEVAEKKLHFDTRQYPHIPWKSPVDLRQQLSERINALMGLR